MQPFSAYDGSQSDICKNVVSNKSSFEQIIKQNTSVMTSKSLYLNHGGKELCVWEQK